MISFIFLLKDSINTEVGIISFVYAHFNPFASYNKCVRMHLLGRDRSIKNIVGKSVDDMTRVQTMCEPLFFFRVLLLMIRRILARSQQGRK